MSNTHPPNTNKLWDKMRISKHSFQRAVSFLERLGLLFRFSGLLSLCQHFQGQGIEKIWKLEPQYCFEFRFRWLESHPMFFETDALRAGLTDWIMPMVQLY